MSETDVFDAVRRRIRVLQEALTAAELRYQEARESPAAQTAMAVGPDGFLQMRRNEICRLEQDIAYLRTRMPPFLVWRDGVYMMVDVLDYPIDPREKV